MEFITRLWKEHKDIVSAGAGGLIGAALGALAGGGWGAAIGGLVGVVGGGLLFGSFLKDNKDNALPPPKPLPGTELTPEVSLELRQQEVFQPESGKKPIQVVEILLDKLKAPMKQIPTLNAERKEIECMVNKSRTGNLSPSDRESYAARKLALEQGDRELAQFIINFEKYEADLRSDDMQKTRKELIEVLLKAGMSQEEIDQKIPYPPMIPIGARIPSLAAYDKTTYENELMLFAIRKGHTDGTIPDAVRKEWDEKGGFAQLNDARNHCMQDADFHWQQAFTAKANMFGMETDVDYTFPNKDHPQGQLQLNRCAGNDFH